MNKEKLLYALLALLFVVGVIAMLTGNYKDATYLLLGSNGVAFFIIGKYLKNIWNKGNHQG